MAYTIMSSGLLSLQQDLFVVRMIFAMALAPYLAVLRHCLDKSFAQYGLALDE